MNNKEIIVGKGLDVLVSQTKPEIVNKAKEIAENVVVKTKEQKELEFVSKMEAVFCEIMVLEEDIKQLKEDAKEVDLDPVLIAQVAKARANGKLQKMEEKLNSTLKLIDRVVGS